MNYVHQLNNLLKLEKAYKNFIPICPNDKVAKLTIEMDKIAQIIAKINGMTIQESLKEAPIYYETKQSKANFIPN